MSVIKGWRRIHEQAVRFCESIERLPDECPCGDAEVHLQGRCSCCGGHTQQQIPSGHPVSCTELLTNLRADCVVFLHDFRGAAGTLEVDDSDGQNSEIRRGVVLAAADLDRVLQKLAQIDEAVVGFRRTCAVSEMRRIKHHTVSLREHFETLDRVVRGGEGDHGE